MSKTTLFDLDGKIAFVSGASRGIGEAIAKLLAMDSELIGFEPGAGAARGPRYRFQPQDRRLPSGC